MTDRATSTGIVDEARVDAVWEAAAELGAAHRSLLDLHLRYGVGPCQLAQDLGTDCRGAADHLAVLVGRLEELAIATLGAHPKPIEAVALFAAAAVKPAPAHAKANAAASLARAGVPMQGSAACELPRVVDISSRRRHPPFTALAAACAAVLLVLVTGTLLGAGGDRFRTEGDPTASRAVPGTEGRELPPPLPEVEDSRPEPR